MTRGLTPTAIPYLDAVWNPVTGCTPAGEGCRHCYAARLAATRLREQPRYRGLACETSVFDCLKTYQWTGEVRFHPDILDAPLHARKPRVIGVCFMGDLFHEGVTDEQIAKVWETMAMAQDHIFVVLTKRPERISRFLALYGDHRPEGSGWITHNCEAPGSPALGYEDGGIIVGYLGYRDWPLPNVVLGTSVWDQESADRNIPHLLDTPAACRVVSLEPMVGAVDPTNLAVSPNVRIDALQSYEAERVRGSSTWDHYPVDRPSLDGIFLGGESGPGARPMQPEWALSVYRQCKAAGVPFYWKQFGDAFDYGYDHDRLGPDFDEMVLTRELPDLMEAPHD